MKFHDVEQNEDEWYALRVGKITSSCMPKIMANYGKAFGEPAKKYAIDVALEQITGNKCGDSYTNPHMDRGHEEEVLARQEYEEVNFCDVSNGGFFQISDDVGCSPDGMVDDCGLVEIKSHVPHIHHANIVRASFNPAYKWQYIANLKFTERDWIDTISYCSSFPDDKRLYVYRINKEDCVQEFEQIDARLNEFRELIIKTKSEILNSKYIIN